MTIPIDILTYNKQRAYPPRHGYQLRGTQPVSIVVHSTSNPNQKNTAFDAEAKFLLRSPDVSAHYLVGKDGRIVRFLDPAPWQAWHAGECREGFGNARSIGIELHHSVGDPPYPQAQKAALAWLLKDLAGVFKISVARIETHGQIAIPGPYDRKRDPSDWPYLDFIQWRNAVFSTLPSPRPYRLRCATWISETPSPRGPIALNGVALVERGEVVQIDEARGDGWCHMANAVGFLPAAALEAL